MAKQFSDRIFTLKIPLIPKIRLCSYSNSEFLIFVEPTLRPMLLLHLRHSAVGTRCTTNFSCGERKTPTHLEKLCRLRSVSVRFRLNCGIYRQFTGYGVFIGKRGRTGKLCLNGLVSGKTDANK
jgi:hypothetical protein